MKTSQYVRAFDPTWYIPELRKAREAELEAETAQIRSSVAPGHIYVIGFTSGVVKVGKTTNPKDRLGSHAMNAAVHAVSVEVSWMSGRIFCHGKAEAELIDFCSRFGTLVAGREYFSIPFESARSRASLVAYNRMPYEAGSVAALLWREARQDVEPDATEGDVAA